MLIHVFVNACFLNHIELCNFFMDRGFATSKIKQFVNSINSCLPPLSGSREEDKRSKNKNDNKINRKWRLNFKDDDWNKYIQKVYKRLQPKKKVNEEEVTKVLKDIIQNENIGLTILQDDELKQLFMIEDEKTNSKQFVLQKHGSEGSDIYNDEFYESTKSDKDDNWNFDDTSDSDDSHYEIYDSDNTNNTNDDSDNKNDDSDYDIDDDLPKSQQKKQNAKTNKSRSNIHKKQVKTLLGNLGRFNTYIRFCIEKQFHHLAEKWFIWKFLPWHALDYAGWHLQFTSCLHSYLKIGVIKNNKTRIKLARYIARTTALNMGLHDISNDVFNEAIASSKITSDNNPNKCWQQVCF